MLEDLLQQLDKNTLLSIAIDITAHSEWIKTKTVANWQKEKLSEELLSKRPAVFGIYKT